MIYFNHLTINNSKSGVMPIKYCNTTKETFNNTFIEGIPIIF